MAFTYDLSTDAGKVRLIIPDSNAAAPIFEDDEIAAFMALEVGIKRAAALALETIASNEALVLKVVKLLDVQTDGAKVSDALLARSKSLRGQATEEEELATGNDGFAIVEMVVDGFGWRQAITQDALFGLY